MAVRSGKQLWDYGTWMMNAELETKRKKSKKPKQHSPHDIFNVGITTLQDDVMVYNRNSGRILFEAESYDEAERLIREEYLT